jgi:phosphoribosyl 1,2-cyclic phosphodiesterase
VRLADGSQLIIDVGSGARSLGKRLLHEAQGSPIHLLLSHPHWDHILGAPSFLRGLLYFHRRT